VIVVTVLKRFTHEGRAYAVGETLRVSAVTAAALHFAGKATATQPSVRRRKTYLTRHLTAESS
jgi:hypothetical protein